MEIKSILLSKLSEIKDEINKNDNEWFKEIDYCDELRGKAPIPWYMAFVLFAFGGTTFNGFNYLSIPIGIYILYIAYKTFAWWEELKEVERLLKERTRFIRDLKIKYNAYQEMKEILCGEDAKYFNI